VSIKDRSVGPHEQVLNVLIVYWCYEPSEPSSRPSIVLGFAPTASLAGSGEKLGTDPRISQRHTVDYVGSPSSREQWAYSILSMTHERSPRTETARRKRTLDVLGLAWDAYMACWSGFPLQGVHRFESP
jgi:hypothetical protein